MSSFSFSVYKYNDKMTSTHMIKRKGDVLHECQLIHVSIIPIITIHMLIDSNTYNLLASMLPHVFTHVVISDNCPSYFIRIRTYVFYVGAVSDNAFNHEIYEIFDNEDQDEGAQIDGKGWYIS